MRLGKKGFVFTAFMVIVVLVLLVSVIVVVLTKENKFGFDRIGDMQLNAIETYQNAEKTLFMIDQAAKYSAFETVYDLAEKGGRHSLDSGCGNYVAYSIWYDRNKECYPTDIGKEFIKTYNDNINQLLNGITAYNTFAYTMLQTSPVKIAASNYEMLKFPITFKTEEAIQIEKEFIPVPNFNKGRSKEIDRLVLHYTAGSTVESALSIFLDSNKQVSAHYIVGKDGRVLQVVEEEDTAWHAGACKPELCVLGYQFMNSRSIGIEIVNLGYNCGRLSKGKCPDGCEKAVKKCWADEAKNSLDRNYEKDRCELIPRCWDHYPPEQWEALVKLAAGIVRRNPGIKLDREHIIGHEEIKYIKYDPGPLFDIDKFIEDVKKEMEKEQPKDEGNNEITGKTIEPDEVVEEAIGSYKVRPNFETTIDYNFSDYEKIKEGITSIHDACVGGAGDIKQCINKEMGKISTGDFKWSLGSCDTGEEAFFYSFVKAYQQCYFSLDDDCLCIGKVYRDSNLNGEIELTMAQEEELVTYYSHYNEITLPGELAYMSAGDPLKPKLLHWKFVFDRGNIKSSTIQNLQSFDEKSFPLYKKDSIIYFMPMDAGIGPKNLCKTTQDHFQFCINNTNKKFPRVKEGEFLMPPITYKFSVIFEDTLPPPKILDLEIKDKETAERSLTLEWSESEAEDVSHYKIYLKDSSFTETKNAENIVNVSSEEERIQANISVEEDNKDYYVGVTAVDSSGNELSEVDSKSEKSLDDLGPKKPGISYAANVVSVTLPTLNQDDSPISEEELVVYVWPFPNQDCGVDYNTILGVQKTQFVKGAPGNTKDVPVSYIAGCYGFTVEDGKGNIATDILKASENQEELIEKLQIP